MFEYKTHGTCSTQIDLEIEDGVITACTIHNGCRGNTAGLAKMVVGRKADDVKELLRGIPCRGATSCPDQLARAIDAYEQQEEKKTTLWVRVMCVFLAFLMCLSVVAALMNIF